VLDSRRTARSTEPRELNAGASVTDQRQPSMIGTPKDSSDVLERVSDGVVALDRNWRYTYVNSRAAMLFGRQPDELVGRHIWTEFPEGVGQPFQLAYQKAMDEQIFIEMENYYEPWDRWFENRIYPSPDGVSIFFHEITERKHAEQAARDNAALLRGHNQVLELIARGEPLEHTLDALLRLIEAQCPGMLCSILLLDSDDIHVRHGAAPTLPTAFVRAVDGQPIGPRAGSCGTAAYRREPVIVADIATDPLWDDYRELALAHGLRACWSTPILDEGRRVLGTFALYFRTPGHPTDQHRRLIELSTSTAAIAIAKHLETHALRASEERLRLAVTRGNIGIWEWTIDTNRLDLSDELKAILGWVPDVPLTQAMFVDAIHADDRAEVVAALDRSLAERSRFDAEFRVPRAASPRWIAVTGRAEYDAAGRPVRMLGVGRDITNRKRAEEETSRREAQLAEAQRLAALGSYEWDVRTNTVDRSEELCRIFGLACDAFEPTFEAYLARVHPEDRDTTRRIVEESFRDGTPFEFEERIIRPDGVIRLLHSQGHWIIDNDRQPVKLVGICQDTTERRRAEDELRRSEQRFQIVARATNDAIWDWDLETNRLWWNQGITNLFGYNAADVDAAIDWKSSRLHPDDLPNVLSGIRALMEAGAQFWSGEYRFRRADGSYADVFDRAFVMYDETGRPCRMIGAIGDITERKRALDILEQRVETRTAELQVKNRELEDEVIQRQRIAELLRDRNEELKAFAYTVSHDLKAPLRGIAGYAQELSRRHRAGLADRAVLCIDQIVTATHNLDRLIEDLLKYSRLDAETPTSTMVDLTDMVDTILADRKAVMLEQSVTMEVVLSATTIRAWERGLFQVLANLIDNALKYSRDATPPRVRVASQTHAGVVRMIVTDNGIGFDMKYHDRIFGLFNRLVRQEEFDGTGAGLAIVKKIVDKVGGKIWAESSPGAGASFFVDWPEGGSPTGDATR
jgi:PAS domain S-box-containing protein